MTENEESEIYRNYKVVLQMTLDVNIKTNVYQKTIIQIR